ncbi:hypothetical protein Q427_26945 [Halomonas sp. BC04]|nr:hypothetical protein Q427_26945 [Halomonas sp. BC04]
MIKVICLPLFLDLRRIWLSFQKGDLMKTLRRLLMWLSRTHLQDWLSRMLWVNKERMLLYFITVRLLTSQ